jgi:hypothetical protein
MPATIHSSPSFISHLSPFVIRDKLPLIVHQPITDYICLISTNCNCNCNCSIRLPVLTLLQSTITRCFLPTIINHIREVGRYPCWLMQAKDKASCHGFPAIRAGQSRLLDKLIPFIVYLRQLLFPFVLDVFLPWREGFRTLSNKT